MTRLLGEDAIQRYRREGFYAPVSVLGPDEAAATRGALESSAAQYGEGGKGSARSHLLFRWMADLIRSPRLLDAVEDLIGPDIMCWGSQWWIKEPRSARFVSWHQDSHYWGIDTDNLVSAWVALSPATVESGCMRCIPGSHLGSDMRHRDTWQGENMLSRGQEIVEVDEEEAVNIEVGTGDAALFDYRLAHASHPNRSDDRRIAIAIRYIPPDARQTQAAWDSATLVRGRDPYGRFEHEPMPAHDFDPVAVAFHRRTLENLDRIVYRGADRTEHRA